MSINDSPVNSNITAYPLTRKEEKSVAVVQKMTILDYDHAVEFVRLFYYEIRTTPGGTEGLIRSRFKNFMKDK
jgi:hypothetical protein